MQYREQAYILAEAGGGTYTNTEIQIAVWYIISPDPFAGGKNEFDANAAALVAAAQLAAIDPSLVASGFFNNFTLYVPTQIGSDAPQSFMSKKQP